MVRFMKRIVWTQELLLKCSTGVLLVCSSCLTLAAILEPVGGPAARLPAGLAAIFAGLWFGLIILACGAES